MKIDEDYVAMLKFLRDYEVENNPEHADWFRDWRNKQIKEAEDIINKEKNNIAG